MTLAQSHCLYFVIAHNTVTVIIAMK